MILLTYIHRNAGQLLVIEPQCSEMSGLSANSYSSGPPRFGGSRGGPPPGKKFGNPGDRLRKKHWNMDELPKFEKNFYQEHPEVARRSTVSKHAMQLGVCGVFFSCH